MARHGVPPLQRGGMAWPACHPPLCRGGEGEPRPYSGTLLIGEMQIILSSRKQTNKMLILVSLELCRLSDFGRN